MADRAAAAFPTRGTPFGVQVMDLSVQAGAKVLEMGLRPQSGRRPQAFATSKIARIYRPPMACLFKITRIYRGPDGLTGTRGILCHCPTSYPHFVLRTIPLARFLCPGLPCWCSVPPPATLMPRLLFSSARNLPETTAPCLPCILSIPRSQIKNQKSKIENSPYLPASRDLQMSNPSYLPGW